MSKSTDTFSTLAAAVLPRSGTPWEGQCSANGGFYHLCLIGNTADNTYTLDLAGGITRMKLTRQCDGSYLTRHDVDRGWQMSSAEDVAIAETLLGSAFEAQRRMFEARDVKRCDDNLLPLVRRSKRPALAVWLRSAATKAVLAATITFILLAIV